MKGRYSNRAENAPEIIAANCNGVVSKSLQFHEIFNVIADRCQFDRILALFCLIWLLTISVPCEASLKFKSNNAFDIGGQPSFVMIQDRDGFIWTGTLNSGLVRFDGYSTKRYLQGPNSISSNIVAQLLEDRDGLIWIGTGNGLNRYDKNTDTFTTFHADSNNPDSLASDKYGRSASTFVEDKQGDIWLGSIGGLSRYNKKTNTFQNFRHDPNDPNSLADNSIWSVSLDNQNQLWISFGYNKDLGVDKLDIATGKMTHFRHDPANPDSLPADDIMATAITPDGNVWLGRRGSGLIKYEPRKARFTEYNANPNDPGAVRPAKEQQRYVLKSGMIVQLNANQDIGFNLFDPATGVNHHYQHNPDNPYSIMPGAISAALEDRDGRLWLVSNSGSVQVSDSHAIQMSLYLHSADDKNSLASNAPIPIFQDKEGTVWTGHFGAGLDRYNPSTDDFTNFRHNPGDPTTIPHDYPCGFFEDELGNFYVSTFNGLSLFDRKAGKVLRHLTTDSRFYTIRQDPDNLDLLWMNGWEQGLCSYHRKTGELKCFLHDENAPYSIAVDTNVRFIIDPDDPNIFWLATWGGGLNRFDKRTRRFSHFMNDPHNPKSISSNDVNDVYVDKYSNFWIATSVGLNLFNKSKGEFLQVGESSGFPPQLIVQSILEDDLGYLWLCTNAGLIRFDPQTRKVVRIYTTSDGLHSHEFFPTANARTQDGRLWIGGFKGLNVIDPRQLKTNPTMPQVFLTSISQNGKNLDLEMAYEKVRALNLKWDNPSFEFTFTAIAYTNPEQNQFAYRLEGMEEKWQVVGNNRSGRYTNIPQGEYVLHIKAANNEGVWSRPGQEMALVVRVSSPPWQTWWFRSLVAAFVLGVTFTGYRLRIRTIEKQRQQLEALVVERTTELQESEARFKTIFEQAAIGVAQIDIQTGLFLRINQKYTDILGYSADELYNLTFMALTHPDDLQNDLDNMERLKAGDIREFSMEKRYFSKEGSTVWVNLTVSPLWRVGEAPNAHIAIVEDITERKKVELALQESSETFSTIFHGSPLIMSITDVETGTILEINEVCLKVLGYSKEELVGNTYTDLGIISKEEREVLKKEILAKGRAKALHIQVCNKSGETLDLSYYGEFINIGGEQRWMQVAEDITERIKTRQALEETSLWLQNMFDSLEEAVFLVTPDRNLVDMNLAAEKIFGYSLLELQEQSTEILHVDHDHFIKFGGEISDSFKEKATAIFEFEMKRKNGEIFPTEHSVSLLHRDDGEPFGIVSVLRDISERRQYEESLLQARQLAEDASEAKSEFLANMSHEIRTPLNAILGMADLLLETNLNQEQKEFVRVFESNGEALLNLINDIIDISKVESGNIHLEKIEFNLLELVEEACLLLAPKAHEKGLIFQFELDKNVPVVVIGDPARLRQVLVNLLSNAIKFTSAGEIIVRCWVQQDISSQVFMDDSLHNQTKVHLDNEFELLFSISDTGIGIPLEKQNTIFDRFVQADTGTTRKYGGTGLGLAISKKLLQLMDGDIWLKSKEGQGSSFYFTVNTAPVIGAKTLQSFFEPIKLKYALIIEESTTERAILSSMLKLWDMHVFEAENEQSAMENLKKSIEDGHPFDVVLIDSRTSNIDGFQVAHKISQEINVKETKIILMLASNEMRFNLLRFQEAGVDVCITKPIRYRELYDTICTDKNALNISLSRLEKMDVAGFTFTRPINILLAEDYIHNRFIIENYLKNSAAVLDTIKNGREAVLKFKAGQYDIVLMDMQMPVKDGFSATQEIRQFEMDTERKAVPIIALTAYALKEDEQKCLDAGCTSYLSKPIKKKHLLKTIMEHCFSDETQEVDGEIGHNFEQISESQQLPVSAVVKIDKSFDGFIDKFLADIKNDIQAAYDALQKNDFTSISKMFHTVAGAGGGYGLQRITDISQDILAATREENGDKVEESVVELADYIENLRIEYV